MIFKELIELLQTVTSFEDLPENLFDELMNASIATGMRTIMNEDESIKSPEALEHVMTIFNYHAEQIAVDLKENELI